MRFNVRYLRHSVLWFWLWLWFGCAVIPGSALASMAGISAEVIGLPIDHFRVSGNLVTQERYLLHWGGLQVGQTLTLPLLNKALQELRDTDLFSTIDFQAERLENGELTLHILVEERRFWLLFPRVSRNSDGDIKAGFRLRMFNLQGADRTLDLLAQQEQESNGDNSEEVRFSYKLPMINKPYDLTWRLGQIVKNTENEGFDNVETIDALSFEVSRDWNLDAFTIPLTIKTSIALQNRSLDEPYPDDIEAREAGTYNHLRLGLIFDDLHRERYRRYGSYYGLTIAQGFEWLGSDYESTVTEFEVINLHRLNRYDNFNSRFVFEVSNDSPYDYPYYDIGGGSTVRGLESYDVRGDARWYSNVELVLAYKKHPELRHTFFVDFGNVYYDLESIELGDIKVTVGTGFRWKLDSFVKTDLILDYGYDIENSLGKIYGGTSLNF
jgi:outer membrane protein insertion porin family